MAYLDIAGNSSYGRYNRKFARIVGLEAAVYWSEILEVLDRVLEKKTFDNDGWFVLNRDYIKKSCLESRSTKFRQTMRTE